MIKVCANTGANCNLNSIDIIIIIIKEYEISAHDTSR